MKIVGVELALLRVPLRVPFRTALRSVEAVHDLVVVLRTDGGQVGYGAAAPTAQITGDTHGSMIAAIREHLAPRLLGREVDELDALCGAVQGALAHNTGAKAAVEIALHDLWGQRHQAPLYRLLGGGTPQLQTDLTISVDTVDTMVAHATDAVARGFAALKLKLGREPQLDVERVRQVHAAVAGRATLRLDANQAWTPEQAVRTLHALEDEGLALDLLEQPVPAHDLDGLQYVTERVDTPVMADESVFTPQDALAVIRRRAADLICIKLAKAGGPSKALRIADLAAEHGVQCMIGCMLESSIGVAAAAHLAVARSNVVTRVDLDTPALCREDPVESDVTFDAARIAIGSGSGLGIRAIRGLQPLST